MSRKIAYIAGAVILLLLLAAVLVPFLIDANQYRPRIEAMLGTALNRKVDIGNIQLSLFAGGVSVDNLSIQDDPAFETGAFLKARSLTVSVELVPLIFSRALHVTGLTISEPEVVLLRNPSGTWNFSTLGASGPKPEQASASGSNADVSVQRLVIENGKLLVGMTGANSKRREYDQVNLEASNLSYTTQFPFVFTAKTPGNGSLKLSGKAGPLNAEDAQKTPLDAGLEVKGLDLASTGFIDPSSGIAGLLDFSGSLNSDGKRVNSKGKMNASKLQVVPGSSPARQPVEVDYDTDYDLKSETGVLKQGEAHIGKALARLTGTYSARGETPSVQMKLTGQNMPATDLEAVLPALGVILPAGASLKEGALNADLTIAGPVDRLVTSGPVNLSNAKLAGFDLGSKMSMLSSFAGLPKGSDTVIQILSSTLRVAPEGIRADNLSLIVPAIGSLAGSGTIAPDHTLNFKMAAKLANSSSPLGSIAKLATLGGQSGGSIPFLIHGTTSNPVFEPDLSGIGKGILSGAPQAAPGGQNLGGVLGGLFGKKK